ncbi:iron-containing alcohol dehydrogenase [Ruminococcus sp. 210702-SL.1.03]|uniref:iron-containing alcohol dehydrogenase n=1 Tax=Ruminococcus sp. 210702-SL.1.03 TaxID=2883233 RepID=UPI001D05D494|nr:iron-containing alcohol dehydrogenase [Ruminococcus sp. 210702-SL.1.03]MCB6615192.1 iron-containing alcohol dehydrogenase [Ruminococcus sp. 210702-SL.1.03]
MDFSYHMPADLRFGRGLADKIGDICKEIGGEKVLVVTGTGSTKRSGLLDRVLVSLKAAGLGAAVFDKVTQNPLTTTVYEGVELAKAEGCGVILGVGGGSIMDAAKAIAFCTVNAGDVSDYIFGKKQGAGALPIVLLPTTCGTGSEGNQIAVLTNPETKDKKALYTMQVMPRVSVIDPDVMTTMPKSVLSSVGFDAFTHSLEAYTSKKANPITDAQALLGMQLLADDLPKLVSGEGGAAEWEAVSLAATLGGMVIGAAGVSAAHGMEHPASGLKNIVHGRGLAALTPPIVERLATADPEKFARVSVLLGGSGAEDCADSIRRFLKAIDLSVKLGDLGITAEDVPWMTENCMKISIGNLKNAPVTFSREEVEQIYREAL